MILAHVACVVGFEAAGRTFGPEEPKVGHINRAVAQEVTQFDAVVEGQRTVVALLSLAVQAGLQRVLIGSDLVFALLLRLWSCSILSLSARYNPDEVR